MNRTRSKRIVYIGNRDTAKYTGKVMDIVGSGSVVAYWPLSELSGSVADNLEGTAARDGAYTGVTLGQPGIGDGGTCPLFDGALDYVLLTSASLTAAWPANEGTIMIWAKVYDASVWTDANIRRAINFRCNTQNQQYLQRTAVNNTLNYYRVANNIADQVTQSPVSSLDWMCLLYTYSVANNQFIAYYNGLQTGTTQTGIGSWAAGTVGGWIGCYNLASYFWYGWLAHALVANRPLVPAEALELSKV